MINCDLFKKIDRDTINKFKDYKDSVINKILSNLRYKLNNDNKLLTLLFIGNTGIGKSRCIDIISKELNRNKIVLDLSEYSYEESITKLIGSSYNQKYKFIDIINNPCSIIEIINYDSASYKIKELFKYIIDNGYCYNYLNEKIYFDNSIIIFCEKIINNIGFNNKIINNFDIDIDDTIVFDSLEKEDVIKCIKDYENNNNVIIDIDYILDNSDYLKLGYKGINKCINKFIRNNIIKAL